MNFSLVLILTLSILAGQIIKVPFGNQSIGTLLDISVGGLSLFFLLRNKKWLKLNQIFLTFFVFILICLLSLILSPLELSFSQLLSSFLYSLRLFLYALFGVLIFSKVINLSEKDIVKVIFLSSLGLSILALLQLLLFPNLAFLESQGWDPHYIRAVATFLDPNFLGGYLILGLLLILIFKEDLTDFVSKNILYLSFVLIFLIILLTFSRSVAINFVVAFFSYLLIKRSTKMIYLTTFLCLAFIVTYFIYQQIVATPQNIDKSKSAQYRLSSWQTGLLLFQNHPILGIGFNNYRYALKEYKLADDQFIQSRGSTANDSSFLFIAATTGTLGVVSFLIFLGFVYKQILSNLLSDKWSFYLFCVLNGTLAQSFFINSFFYPTTLFWLFLIISRLPWPKVFFEETDKPKIPKQNL